MTGRLSLLTAFQSLESLIQAPPIELWPAVMARVEVPADVEEILLIPVRAGLQSRASHHSSTKVEGQERG